MLEQSVFNLRVMGKIAHWVVNASDGINSSLLKSLDRSLFRALKKDNSWRFYVYWLQKMHLLKSFRESIHNPSIDLTVRLLDSVLNDAHDQVIRHKLSLLNGVWNDLPSFRLLRDLISEQIHRWDMNKSISLWECSCLSSSSWPWWAKYDQPWRSLWTLRFDLDDSLDRMSCLLWFLCVQINLS